MEGVMLQTKMDEGCEYDEETGQRHLQNTTKQKKKKNKFREWIYMMSVLEKKCLLLLDLLLNWKQRFCPALIY